MPLEISVDGTLLRFISTTTVFGRPIDVTLVLESFFPGGRSHRQDDYAAAASAP